MRRIEQFRDNYDSHAYRHNSLYSSNYAKSVHLEGSNLWNISDDYCFYINNERFGLDFDKKRLNMRYFI